MVARNNKNNNSQHDNANNQGGETEDGFLRISLVNQGVFVRKKKVCPLKEIPVFEINYKNLRLLNKFISERGKILPSRITNVSMKKQKAVANAIKRARHLALLSPIGKEANQI
jgi:small subunit ribosomal protein S18